MPPELDPPPELGGHFGDFDQYYESDKKKLITFLLRLGASMHEAEDVHQEAMIEVFKAWERLSVTNPAAYARTVAERRYLRSRARLDQERRKLLESDWAHEQPYVEPDTMFFSKEARGFIEAMNHLSFGQRRVLAWHIDGFSITEIAELTEQPPATVRSHLRHAKNNIKPLVERLALRRKMISSAGRRPDDEQRGR